MESVAKGIGSLLRDPKYSDLEIRCDGRTYYVHRAIVCSGSHVLAKECDGDFREANEGVIEHVEFDALTLERMLQFMYEGDYTVRAATLEVAKENGVNGIMITNLDSPKSLPPHLRSVSASSKPNDVKKARKIGGTTNTMTAHVLVYAIAECYEIPELKKLALQKFTNSKEMLSINDFLQLAKTIYDNTNYADDEMRKELLIILIADYKEWLATETFINALANDTDLHEFAVTVMSAVHKRYLENFTRSAADNEAQAAASKLLLSDLDQANEALARSDQRVRRLETDVQKTKAENFKLEGELKRCRGEKESYMTANNLVQSDLDQANEGLARSSHRVIVLEGQIDALQSELQKCKAENTRLDRELITSRDRCNQYSDKANTNSRALNERNQQLKKETARADDNYKLCNLKDAVIKDETARADKATAIWRQIISLVNSTYECRQCGLDFDAWLQKDDRCADYPSGSMLRCRECRTRHYGTQV